ncbi:MAG: alpha-ketoacid dehydrogenase subunit beta [Sphingomonadales bacterium]|nr:alpha-ketoacid dehydrogenase subunit beta [Sphingomonadales bacterium]RIK94990.1 MAG: alpha-ketoacid dehydrogenase subunit beta [Pseudomonadota bacterium]
MSVKSYRAAIREALEHEMQRDPDVVLIGQDLAGGAGGGGEDDAWGGPMAVTKGLVGKFGRERVLDTPVSEAASIGAAVGAAAAGLRPVAELMFCDFIGVCCDQILNQAAKYRYTFGGQDQVPLTIRTTIGAGQQLGSQHSQALYPLFSYFPGLKVVVPATAYDAKGLLATAIRDNDPVIFCEHRLLYRLREDVPDESYTIPFGEARIVEEGGDVTVVALSRMVHVAAEAVRALREDGIDCDLIDPRTTTPLDTDTIFDSVEATGRLVIVDEAGPRCGTASDIAAIVAEEMFNALRAPIRRVTPPYAPVPAAPELERSYVPDASRIIAAVRSVMER